MIIAIDGPSASGKGTIAKALAQELGYHHLDTGSLYRMVGLEVMRRGLDAADEVQVAGIAASLNPATYADADLRGEEVGNFASRVAALPKVRGALLKFQRDFAARAPGAVLDGRDIGTVICPDADFKFYITASVEDRALRRFKDSPGADLEAIKTDIAARDKRDSERTTAPLKPATDAVIVDTSNLTPLQALWLVMSHIRARG